MYVRMQACLFVYLRVYICMYVYMCVHLRGCMCVLVSACKVCACMYMSLGVPMPLYMHGAWALYMYTDSVCVYVSMHACMYVFTYAFMCVCMYVCMHACMHVCMLYVCMWVSN